MVQQGMLDMWSVNKVLAEDNSSVRFKIEGFDEDIEVTILSETELEEENVDPDHPNIRILSQRMDQAFEAKDYAGVLHASANIFETLAKLVFNNPNVENKTLASLFDGYRKRSSCPNPFWTTSLRPITAGTSSRWQVTAPRTRPPSLPRTPRS
jgi:hypothetical protein